MAATVPKTLKGEKVALFTRLPARASSITPTTETIEVFLTSCTMKPTVGPPVHMSRTPTSVRSFAPDQGEHTDEILLESGFSEAEVADFRARGAFGSEVAGAAAAGA
jgi:hypothetical protein